MNEQENVIRILAVMSSPTIVEVGDGKVETVGQLQIEDEWRALCEAVQDLPVQLVRCYPPTLNRMEEMLRYAASPNQNTPFNVVHFSGHGNVNTLLFSDEALKGDSRSAEEIGETLRESNVKLAILSACFSGTDQTSKGMLSVSTVLSETYIPAVVFTNDSVSDMIARDFSKSFFGHISNGYTLQKAFDFAIGQLKRHPVFKGAQAKSFEITGRTTDTLEGKPGKSDTVHNVPPQFYNQQYVNEYFFGREIELAKISSLLGAGRDRIVTIVGVGGSGKSTLAREIAKRNAWRYPGGLVWVDFIDESAIMPSHLRNAVAVQLDIDEKKEGESDNAFNERIMDHLRAKRCLIICDNIETIAHTARNDDSEIRKQLANELVDLISGLPSTVQVLCTGREKLGTTSEHQEEILGLDPEAGLQYFLEIVKDNGRELDIIYTNDERIPVILDTLKTIWNIPLAIYLAATSWAKSSRSLNGLKANLEKAYGETLADPIMTGTNAERHRSINASILYSLKMLESDAAKKLFPKLSVFAVGAGFVPLSLKHISKMDDWEGGLSELYSKNLVRRVPFGETFRYYFFPPIAEFADNELTGEERQTTQKAFAELFAGISHQCCLLIDSAESIQDGMNAMEAEIENILFALDLALENNWLNGVKGIQDGFDRYYKRKFSYEKLYVIVLRILEFDEKNIDRENTAIDLLQLGMLADERFEFEEANRYFERALELFIVLEMRTFEAGTLHHLGILAAKQNEYTLALGYFNEALEIFIALEENTNVAGTLHHLGMLATKQNKYDEALDYYKKAQGIFLLNKDKINEAATLHQMGLLATEQRKYDEALDYYNCSILIKEEINDNLNLVRSIWSMGKMYDDWKKPEEAIALFLKGLMIAAQFELSVFINDITHDLFNIYEKLGKTEFYEIFLQVGKDILDGEEATKEMLDMLLGIYEQIENQRDEDQ